MDNGKTNKMNLHKYGIVVVSDGLPKNKIEFIIWKKFGLDKFWCIGYVKSNFEILKILHGSNDYIELDKIFSY